MWNFEVERLKQFFLVKYTLIIFIYNIDFTVYKIKEIYQKWFCCKF